MLNPKAGTERHGFTAALNSMWEEPFEAPGHPQKVKEILGAKSVAVWKE